MSVARILRSGDIVCISSYLYKKELKQPYAHVMYYGIVLNHYYIDFHTFNILILDLFKIDKYYEGIGSIGIIKRMYGDGRILKYKGKNLYSNVCSITPFLFNLFDDIYFNDGFKYKITEGKIRSDIEKKMEPDFNFMQDLTKEIYYDILFSKAYIDYVNTLKRLRIHIKLKKFSDIIKYENNLLYEAYKTFSII